MFYRRLIEEAKERGNKKGQCNDWPLYSGIFKF